MSFSGGIKRIFGGFWRLLTALRRAVFNLLFLVVLIIFFVVLFNEEGLRVPDSGALILSPSGVVVDQFSYIDPVSSVVNGNAEIHETLLADMIKAIDLAAKDTRIKVLVIQTDAMEHAGLSKLQELALAIARFRESGKPVIATGDSFSQDQYWLAAQADRVVMNPMGEVLLQGYGVYTNFFKQALDKLAVNFHVFRVGTYKSAVEPFLRDDMSTEVKQNHLVWLGALWQQYKEGVAARRKIAPEKIDEYANHVDTVLAATDGDAGKAALDWHLVDALESREEFNRALIEQVGEDEDGLYNAIDFRDYLLANRHLPSRSTNKVGVIVASGMILDGEQRSGLVGGDTLSGLLRQARLDEDVKAVVLRVDSEGGSAFASEIIRQQLLELQAEGKPVVVSMGSIAASGGYWISANADEVWATPATITGSIGIFGAFPTVEDSLSKLGVHTDGVGTTQTADAFRVDRPLSPAVASAIQSGINAGYQRFLGVVAKGRNMPESEVDKIAQGQVWAGSDAKRIGLVDQLGGLDDAIRSAAALANLTDFTPEPIKPPLSPQEMLMARLTGVEQASARIAHVVFDSNPGVFDRNARLPQNLAAASALVSFKPLLREWQRLSLWNDPRSTYVFCGECARL
jgi:protease-4